MVSCVVNISYEVSNLGNSRLWLILSFPDDNRPAAFRNSEIAERFMIFFASDEGTALYCPTGLVKLSPVMIGYPHWFSSVTTYMDSTIVP
jgi:hypothetical protein